MQTPVRIVHIVSAVLLIIAVVINCANVAGRYLFSHPIASAEEIMLFLLVGVVFFGNSVVAFRGRQIRMDILLHLLPDRIRQYVEVAADIVAIVMSVVLIVLSVPVITMLAEFDQRSQAADVPLVIPQIAIPIGLGLTAVFLCLRLALIFMGRGAEPAGAVDADAH